MPLTSVLRIPQAYIGLWKSGSDPNLRRRLARRGNDNLSADVLRFGHTRRERRGHSACVAGTRFASIRTSLTSLAQRNAFMTPYAIASEARFPTQVGAPCFPHAMCVDVARPAAGMQR